MKTVKSAWIFDVDGVITSLQTRQIAQPQILDELIKRLRSGNIVAFITGRSHEWILKQVIRKLEDKINNKNILDNLFISEEFGGMQSYYKNGLRIDSENETFSVPNGIFIETKNIVKREFLDSMFIDPKISMASIEMKEDFPIDKFKILQKQLILEIQNILEKYDRGNIMEIHEDHIATNIKNKNANKRYAANQMLSWLSKKGINPEIYFVFGDNISDKQISDELFEKRLNVELVFVGDKNELKNSTPSYKTIIKDNKLDKGTLEFLKSM
jgi:hypothetical protein